MLNRFQFLQMHLERH